MKNTYRYLSAAIALVALVMFSACGSQQMVYMSTSFHEPATDGLRYIYSEDGLHWDSIPGTWLAPEVGKQKVMRDPSIQQSADGTFHFVWTSSWRGDRGFGYSSSKDLIHWTPERFIEVMPDTATVNVWAPELFWDDTRQEMMVIWASCIPGKFERGIEEEKNNHRLYYITTKDFKTISDTKLLIDPGYSSIDATLVKRRPNDYVMVVKDNTRPNRNIKISFASDPHGPWAPTSAAFTPEFCEGPSTLLLPDNRNYVVYCDRYRLADFGAYMTRDFINFEDITAKTRIPQGHKHGTIFKVKKSLLKAVLDEAKHRKK